MPETDTLTLHLLGADQRLEQARNQLVAALSREEGVSSQARAQLLAGLARPEKGIGSVAVRCPSEHAQEQADVVRRLCNRLHLNAIVSIHRPVRLKATFQGQAWIRDYAVATDDVHEFEAGDLVVAMDAEQRDWLYRQLTDPANDFDALAEAAWADGRLTAYNGPFEVYVDQEQLEAVLTAVRRAERNEIAQARLELVNGHRVAFSNVVGAGLELTRGEESLAVLYHPDASTTRVYDTAGVSLAEANDADRLQWYEPRPSGPAPGSTPTPGR